MQGNKSKREIRRDTPFKIEKTNNNPQEPNLKTPHEKLNKWQLKANDI